MATTVPTTQEILDQNISNLEVRIGQSIPANEKAFFRVLAALESGLFTSHYKYATDRLLQTLALTATGEDLDRIGINYRVYRKAAVAWVGTIQQPAANGTVIPITVDYVADASAIRYIVNTASAPAAGGYATVSVTASEAGENGNLSASDTLTIGFQIAGITNTTATYASTVTTGTDRETDEVYRRRVLQEIRTVGGGGNATDYKTWSEEVTGVFRSFPFAGAPVSFNSRKLKDSNMEYADVSYWTAGSSAVLTKESGAPYGGTYSLRVAKGSSGSPYASQVCLQIGRDYTVYGYAKGDGTNVPTVRDGSAATLWTGTSSTSWQLFSVLFTAQSNSIRLQGTLSGSGYVEFDTCGLTLMDSQTGDRVVYVEATTDIDADGEPTQAILDAVRTALTADPDTGEDRMPLGLTDEKLFVEPISRLTFDVEITGLVVETSRETDCKASLDTGVDEYFRSVAPFVDGVDSEIDRNDTISNVSISEVVQGVLDAYGASASSLTFEFSGGSPLDKYTVGERETAKLGTITYVGGGS